jgi:hypothetical protein
MKSADPNSKRSQRRAKRNFTASRPVRRAKLRLEAKLIGYKGAIASDKPEPYTKPGALTMW